MKYILKNKIFSTSSTFTALCLFLTGCGSVCRGRTQDVQVTSSPRDATIFVDNMPCGETPQIIRMTRKNEHHILLMKEGYQPQCYRIKPKLSGYLAGNLGYIGLGAGVGAGVGLAVGASTGDPMIAILAGGGGAIIGTAVGILASAGGIGTDLVTGGGYNLCNHVHGQLQPLTQ